MEGTIRLLLVGGGHAHLNLLNSLPGLTAAGIEAILLSPETSHPYSGMAPGMVGGQYQTEEILFPVERIVEDAGGKFVLDEAVAIDGGARIVTTSSGEQLSYDVVSLNVGSVVPFESLVPGQERDAIGVSIFPAKPVRYLHAARQRIRSATPPERVAVVGGGPGGVELAANIKSFLGAATELSLYASSAVVPRQSDRFRQLVRDRLTNLGVLLREHSRVAAVGADWINLSSNGRNVERVESDMTILATGVVPPPLIGKINAPIGPRGGLLVNRELRSVSYPTMFGGGDCIDVEGMPLDRVGVYAVRESAYLAGNIRAELLGGRSRRFKKNGEYLIICNLADGYGVGEKRGFVARGGLVGGLKDLIDRRFMRKYQR